MTSHGRRIGLLSLPYLNRPGSTASHFFIIGLADETGMLLRKLLFGLKDVQPRADIFFKEFLASCDSSRAFHRLLKG